MTLEKYFEKLVYHDWYYHYSDDNSIFSEGHEEQEKLIRVSELTPDHLHLYRQFHYLAHGGFQNA